MFVILKPSANFVKFIKIARNLPQHFRAKNLQNTRVFHRIFFLNFTNHQCILSGLFVQRF